MGWACRSPRIGRIICRGRCRRRFGRSWAKALTKKGKFVFLVNEALSPPSLQEAAGGSTPLAIRALPPIFLLTVAAPGGTRKHSLASHWLPKLVASQEKTMRFDARTVAGLTLPVGKADHFCWNSDLAGLGLRLRTSGRKVWLARYRPPNSRRTRRVTLGNAETLTPAQAREAARKVLAAVALGQDPQGERQAQRQREARTFRSAIEAYLAAKRDGLRPASYRIAKLYLLDGDYFRPLHKTGVNEITHPDIAARLSAISRKRSTHTAAAARRAISAAFRWFMEEGWLRQNPVIGTRKPA